MERCLFSKITTTMSAGRKPPSRLFWGWSRRGRSAAWFKPGAASVMPASSRSSGLQTNAGVSHANAEQVA